MLVTVDEQIAYMSGITLSAQQKAEVGSVVSGVQSELELYCNRPLELTQVREIVRTDQQGVANLSVSPVWSIVSVGKIETGAFGTSPNSNSLYIPPPMERDPLVDEGGLLRDRVIGGLSAGGPLIVPGGVYLGTYGYVHLIEYVGGYNLKSNAYEYEGVRNAIKRVAAREIAPLHDDTLSLRGDKAERADDADSREKGWTIEELRHFDRLRRRTIA